MKRVLIIAYYFPPIQSSGVYRPLKFVKYLREFGWEPVVLTVRPSDSNLQDPDLLRDVPDGVQVVRTVQLHFKRLVGLFKRNRPAARPATPVPAADDAPPASPSTLRRMLSALKTQLALFTRGVFFVPDDEVPWMPLAAFRAVQLARRQGFDAVITTSPPHSAHLAGLLTRWVTGVPWLVDFRDLWMDEFDFYDKPYGGWRRPVEAFMERRVIRRADCVVSVSRGECASLQADYNRLPADKFQVIHNGFDPEDFTLARTVGAAPRARLRITYMGTLYASTADEFFAVLADLYAADPSIATRLEIRFVGPLCADYQAMMATAPYADMLTLLGPVPHDVAVSEMQASDVLLVLIGGDRMKDTEVPGKIYEYMAAERPILALVRPGDTATILAGSGLANIINPGDAPAIRQALLDLLSAWEQGDLSCRPDREFIDRYSRRQTTGRLAALLDGLVEARNRKPGVQGTGDVS